MAFLDWSESLSVGYRLLDTDHKRLIDLINKLHDATAQQGHTPAAVLEALNALIDYTKAHFTHEETLMHKTGYPQYIPHKIEHDRLMQQVDDFRKRYEAGQTGLSQENIVFLRTWLCDHIVKVDRFLGQWLAKTAPLVSPTQSQA